MTDLAGRTAFITGAARGIGLAIATSLAQRGAKVAITDRDPDALEAAHDTLSGLTETAAFVLDVRDRAAFATVADQAETALGPVTLLLNNAGLGSRTLVDQMSYESWDLVLDVNLGGVVNGLQTFVPRILERGDTGHIVNTSSGAGLVAAGQGYLYHASKFAVVGLSESLRDELAPKGIGVTVLCPGPVTTDIVSNSQRIAGATTGDSSAELDAWHEAMRQLVATGVPPKVVGEQVVDAIEANDSAWIFTDATIAPLLTARADALAAALPPADK